MVIHIGSLIKARAKSMRIGPTELGAKIETSKQNVYGIFKRKSIDTDLLMRISFALDHDFFQHLSTSVQIPSKVGETQRPSRKPAEPADPVDHSGLERENEYLRRINSLLEEKVAHLEKLVDPREEIE
jgi:hypothetical protein